MGKTNEDEISLLVKNFLIKKENGNWHEEGSIVASLKGKGSHGADIILKGGSRNSEYFIIECKGKSLSKTASQSSNRESWVTGLGQLITRMNTKRIIQSGKHKGDINRAYKYGLAMPSSSAIIALRRIPKEIAKVLNLYIFSVNDKNIVKQFSPKDFNKKYSKEDF